MKKVSLITALQFAVLFTFSQNIGVGTIAPLYKLHVHGDLFVNSGQGEILYGYPGADYKWRLATINGGQDLMIRSENQVGLITTRAYFQQNGYVGLGTSAPVSPLHIKSTSSTNPFTIDGSGNNTYYSILENGTYRGYWGSYSGNPEDVDFGTGAGTSGKVHLTIQANPKLTIDNTGNVGLGNTSPTAKLDVISNSSSSVNNNFMLRNSNGDTLVRVRDNGFMGIGYNGAAYGRPLNIQGAGVNFYHDAATFGGSIFPDLNSNLIVWSNNSGPGQNVVLQPSWGQVAIGTYSPATGYKLSVNGKAIFTEVRVQVNGSWPDYVFKKNYKLPMLDDLEKSINLNQHLPNIPAASAIEMNGIDLGDMNRRLLEKVEELTLYIIDMNKKIVKQDKRIAELEKK